MTVVLGLMLNLCCCMQKSYYYYRVIIMIVMNANDQLTCVEHLYR